MPFKKNDRIYYGHNKEKKGIVDEVHDDGHGNCSYDITLDEVLNDQASSNIYTSGLPAFTYKALVPAETMKKVGEWHLRAA